MTARGIHTKKTTVYSRDHLAPIPVVPVLRHSQQMLHTADRLMRQSQLEFRFFLRGTERYGMYF